MELADILSKNSWKKWLTRWLSHRPLRDHVPARPPQWGIGSVVKDRISTRVVYREYDEVGNLSPKKITRITLRKHAKLARRFNEWNFDIQCESYSSIEAFNINNQC